MQAPKFQRKPVAASAAPVVDVRPLVEGHALPMLVTPCAGEVRLTAWVAAHRAEVDALLRQHHALLFRGFYRQHADQFAEFVRCTSDGEPLAYVDRTTPRNELGSGLYTSTTYPARLPINLHNEGTYWTSWPLKLYFCCVTPAESGGETPIADQSNVLDQLSPSLRSTFEHTGFLLERNYNDGLGLPWQEVFQTTDPRGVEHYCAEHGIRYAWRGDGRLQTQQVRRAIRKHPWTGKDVWFNHAVFYHRSSYPPDVLHMLENEVGPTGLPYRTMYGDGTPIPDDAIAEIRALCAANRVAFPWQAADMLLLDNMAVAHAREPYRGDRLVAVAMKEPHGEQDA
jgi:alpha-ketoglutarate-dependent taurine dioxygenase